jgi:uncharacterized phage-associated protein
MYDARAVSNFFLDRAQEAKLEITVMTLLKVLYFGHAWYLSKYQRPLVAQPFEAWKYGPVNRVVYDQYSQYGKKPIDKKAVSFDVERMGFYETVADFDSDTEKFLRDIFGYYARFHPFHLSDLTHEKGSPWDIIWSEAGRSAVPGMTIPNSLIASWFSEQGGLDWTNGEQRRVT